MSSSTIISISIFLSILNVIPLSSQIKNGDFELWDTVIIEGTVERYFEIPRHWMTWNRLTENTAIITTPVTKDTHSVNGKYAARIESNDWGLDSKFSGIMEQTIPIKTIEKISYRCKCDSLWMKASCTTQILDKSTYEILYSDSLKTVDEAFKSYEINRADILSPKSDSVILRFIADGINGIIDYDEIGYSVMLVDNVSIDYLSSTQDPHFNFKLYPNPFTSEIHITADELVNIKLWNVEGMLVKEIDTIKSQIINTTDLPKGIYMIQLQNEKRELTEKLIKQ